MAPRIAVIGAGLVGARHVAEAAGQGSLAAIVDPAPEAASLAERHDVPHFTALEACLDAVPLDGVIIATPNHLHADHALLCLAAKLPVLIEKPIADTLENADRIVAAAAASGTPVLIGHHRRHNPIIGAARHAISSGMLGEITVVTGQFWLHKPDDYFDAAWRGQAGAGPMLINCIHDVDLMRYLCGDIEEVMAMTSNARRGFAVEDTAGLVMRFANGAIGTFSLSDTVAAPWSWEMNSGENPVYPHVPGSCYRIGGRDASLSIPDLELWRHRGAKSWWEPIERTVLEAPSGDAFSLQFQHFCAVIGGAAPLVSAAEGRASLATVLACLPENSPI